MKCQPSLHFIFCLKICCRSTEKTFSVLHAPGAATIYAFPLNFMPCLTVPYFLRSLEAGLPPWIYLRVTCFLKYPQRLKTVCVTRSGVNVNLDLNHGNLLTFSHNFPYR